jgi:hypothetical protein
MKKLLLPLFLMLLTLSSFSQSYTRLTNESAEAFTKRVLKVDELAHPVIETKEWDSTRKVIFAFVNTSVPLNNSMEEEPESVVVGYCFLKTTGNNYQRALIDTFPENGGEPVIETVFFVNADKDKEREIAIVVRTMQIHRGASIYGNYYEVFFYNNPDVLAPPAKLILFEQLSAKFSGFDGDRENKHFTFAYKDVKAIRKALKEMGY